jgi:thiol-disulfide isomerase/thioredoxin
MRFITTFALLLTGIASALELPSTDGKTYDPAAAGDKKAVALFFVSPFCSTTKSFMKEINQIAADYGDRVAFHLIHSDPEITLEVALEHPLRGQNHSASRQRASFRQAVESQNHARGHRPLAQS